MLKKNDIVDVISPGTACTRDELEKIKNYVKKIGLTPRIFLEKETSLAKSTSHEFASIDAKIRFEQLKKSIESADSKIIWCTRGGYGSAEILPLLQKMKKPKQQKIFIGFSDISALNIFLIQQWGWQVISAPMLVQLTFNKVSKKSEKGILDLIFGKKKELKYQLISAATIKQTAPAIVTGGCTSVLSSHFGTNNQLDWHNKILFLEDEGEDGERLDRYFHQIVTIIDETKKKPRAIILGNFLQANPHGTPRAENIKIAVRKFSEKLEKIVPVFAEKTHCLGHGEGMMPLVLGAKAEIIKNGFLVQKINTIF
ncbi:MAG: LD-carboxypeptidase [Proteobacteria bacterium]|nr:LD-carboxypeptidase [Pseudomonadota bacterium]